MISKWLPVYHTEQRCLLPHPFPCGHLNTITCTVNFGHLISVHKNSRANRQFQRRELQAEHNQLKRIEKRFWSLPGICLCIFNIRRQLWDQQMLGNSHSMFVIIPSYSLTLMVLCIKNLSTRKLSTNSCVFPRAYRISKLQKPLHGSGSHPQSSSYLSLNFISSLLPLMLYSSDIQIICSFSNMQYSLKSLHFKKVFSNWKLIFFVCWPGKHPLIIQVPS